jgi:hypothetical protein
MSVPRPRPLEQGWEFELEADSLELYGLVNAFKYK